jgi:PAT family beta-lactamase induction signal transducer AmpG
VAPSSRFRLLVFAGLYFAQGIPWGFFTVAMMLRLSSLGATPATLGELTFAAWLPWACKPMLGPLVDWLPATRWGRRRPFILAAQTGMALTLLALAFVEPLRAMGAFTGLLLVHNLFAAAQDVGTDALAIDLLPENERGRANGLMAAGKFAGVVVGGQGLLWVAQAAGWPVAFAAAIALLLVPSSLVIAARETGAAARPSSLGVALRSFTGRTVMLAALFAFAVDWCDSLLFPLTYPLFQHELGYSEQQLASLATLGGVVAALGSLAGGVLCDRWGRRRTLFHGCLALAAVNLSFALGHQVWSHYAVLVAFTVAGGAAGGMVYAATVALLMDLTDPRLGATQFQIYMSLLNARSATAARLGGGLAERLPAPFMFGLGALAELLPLVLLPWLAARGRAASGEAKVARATLQA